MRPRPLPRRRTPTGPSEIDELDELDVLVDVATPYATIGSIMELLWRLAEATDRLQRYIAGLEGTASSSASAHRQRSGAI